MQPTESQDKKQNLFEILKRLAGMYVEDIRLTSAEKLTILMSGVAIFSILMVLTVIALIFVAIGITNLLEAYIAPFWSYFIIAGILVLLIVALVLLKDRLVVDPIARFISKLLLNSPKNTTKQ